MKTAINLKHIKKLVFSLAILLGTFSYAQVLDNFTPRYNETIMGDVTMIANNMLSRHATNNYNGSDGNHDFSDNVYVDIDSDATTFNSSNATFSNPEPALTCLNIDRVLLYWAAADKEPDDDDQNSENQPGWNFNDVKLMLPGEGSYTTYTADDIIYRGRDSHFSNDPYICVKDITTEVLGLSSPYGVYQVANVEAKIGDLDAHGGGNTGTSGGWQIVFVYESPKLPAKNITLFDGYAHVTSSVNNFNIDFNGFQTISTGAVDAKVVIGSLEGDRDLSGDRLQIRNTLNNFVDVSVGTIRSTSNFFNSRVTIDNANFTNRVPASTNTLGFDAAVFTLDNPANTVIGNNQTSATMRLTSNQETYGLFLVGLSVSVWAPELNPMVLMQSSGSNPADPGDILDFGFSVSNQGNDDAINVVLSTIVPDQVANVTANSLPAGITYNFNSGTGLLEFFIADGMVNVGGLPLDIDFSIEIEDECYFLEDDCDLDFDLQFTATYNGVQNPNQQTTISSSGLNACNQGNNNAVSVSINQPTVSWATAAGDLDATVDCGDTTALNNAQALEPTTDICSFTLTKTSGAFVPDPDCPNAGTYTNTWSFTDACGVTIADYTQTITVQDTTPPVIDPEASDLTVECDGAGNTTELNNWLNSNGGASATDDCGGVVWSNDFTALSDDCGETGSATVTFTATDSCGNQSTTVATFTIEDTVAPTIDTDASDLTVECDGAGNATELNNWLNSNGGAAASDDCSSVTWSNDFSGLSDDCGETGSATVTFTATDDCGNQSTTVATFTIEDTVAPTIDTDASDLTVECDGAGNATELNNWLNSNGGAAASDDCSSVTWSNDFSGLSDDCGETGSATVTFTATDDCGNQSTTVATFTIEDTVAPTIDTDASDLTVECDGAGNATELNNWLNSNGGAAASDDCSSVTWSNDFSGLSDDCGETGSATVTFTATDDCGNQSTTVATFTIEDTVAPTIDTDASDLTVECDGAGNSTELNNWLNSNGGAAASDDCSSVTWSNDFSGLSDDCGETGSATVTFTATDDCGNQSTTVATFTIEDTVAPTIDTDASDLTVECDGAGNTTELNDWLNSNGGAAASDDCSSITWSNDFSGLSDDCGETGSATVTFTATDDCGNQSTTVATFTIEDTVAPTIDTDASDLTVECDGAGNSTELNNWLNSNGGAAASDDCSSVTWSNDFSGLSDDCGETGSATVTFTATDDCGNQSTTVATFTIEDTVAPTIDTDASDLTVECDGAGNTTELNDWLNSNGGAAASDDCSSVTWSNDFSALSDDCGETGSATVTFTATDDCGNQSTTVATFTIEDTVAPTIDTDASDLTVECDGAGNSTELNNWLNSNGGAVASDDCSSVTWSNDFSALSDDCGETGSATVTFTATDDCGNQSTTVATFTIEDTTAPTFTVPADITIECDVDSTDLSITGDVTDEADSCSGPIDATYSDVVTPGSCANESTITRTWTLIDDCGNTTTADQTINVVDTTPPTITTVAADQTVQCDGSGNTDELQLWLDTQAGAQASDNCGNITWTNDFTGLSDGCGETGLALVTFTATDDCGNSSSTTALFTIIDLLPPSIDTDASDLTVECDGSGNSTELNDWLNSNGGAISSDICGDVTWSHDFSGLSDDCGETGTATVTFTATDDCGNEATTVATFTIEDTTAPTFTAPADITIECDVDPTDLSITGDVTDEADSCSGPIDATYSDSVAAGACSGDSVITRTWSLTDDCGNTTTIDQTITVQDTTAPTIDVEAADQTVECDGSGNATELNDWLNSNGGASASDNCSAVTWSNDFSGLSDDCGETGTATVTFTATDDCGNQSTTVATFTIEDTIAPTIDVEASDITVECDGTGNNGEIQDWLDNNGGASASDDCSNVTWTNDYNGAASDCSAPVLVTFTATDDCGNQVTTSASYAIQDTTAPTIDVEAADQTVECDGAGNSTELNDWLNSNGGATASDDCSAITWSNDFSGLSDDCGETGSATVTFTATDGCGNQSSTTATFVIEDTTAPTFTAPADITIECDVDPTDLSITGDVTDEADSCSGPIDATYSDSVAAGACSGDSVITRTWSLTDDCGNTTTIDQTITVQDTTAPTIDVEAADQTVECDGSGNATELNDWLNSNGGASASDNCSAVTWSNDFSGLSDDCGETGTATVTFTATDDCGNQSTTVATFTIEDTIAPTIDVEASDITVECDGTGNNGEIQDWLDNNGGASASDDCSNVTWTNDYNGAASDCSAPVLVTFTATDDCGNQVTTSASYAIQDTTAPTIDVEAADQTVECDGAGNSTELNDWLNSNGGATASDDCSAITWSNDFSGLSDDCGETGSATVTFTATDGCGNQTSTSATFTIADTVAPTIDADAADLTVECDGSGNATELNDWLNSNGGASASDDCSSVTWSNDFSALSDDCGETGSATVTFTATDDCGNQSTTVATFTIEDTTAPTFTAPADITIECDVDPTDLSITGDVTDEADSCSGPIDATYSDSVAAGACSGDSVITRTWSLTDDCGNTTTIDQTITVQDTTAPTIEVEAADQTVECDGSGNATELNDWLNSNGGASASDNCSAVTWSNDFSSLSDDCGETGTATVTFTATDECGNTASVSATFTIVDTTAPVIDGDASDVTVECDGSGNADDLNDWLNSIGGATVTDDCSSVTWTNDFSELSDECGNTGSATVTFTATDECGNSASVSATFTIVDTTAPVIDDDASDVTVDCDGSGNSDDLNDWLNSNGGASASDDCSDVTWTNDFSEVSDECGNSGSATVTFTATDECGNSSSTTATFTIIDNTAPTIDVDASDLTVECDASGNTTDLEDWLNSNGGASASDNCSDVSWTNDFTELSDECGNTGSATVTFTATDECGNSASVTATFSIVDTTAPVVTTEFDEEISVNCSEIPEAPQLEFEDACATEITVEFSETSTFDGTNSDYEIIYEWIVSDDCDNTDIYTQIIFVTNDSDTVGSNGALCIDDSAVDLFNYLSGNFGTDGEWTVTSGDATLDGSIFDPSTVELGDYEFTYTDDSECSTEAVVQINVNDDCVVLPCGAEDVIISKAVTPNGDQYNEFFEVTGIQDCGYVIEVQIYNRWGARIHEDFNYQNDWRGTAHSNSVGSAGTVPAGTYYYVVKLRNSGLRPFSGPLYVGTR